MSDRRHLRRAETIDQLLATAVDVMAEQGAGGLSLGEVARRMDLRTPSLYVYFPSKNAVYDAVFRSGWQQLLEALRAQPEPQQTDDLERVLQGYGELFVRWCLEHPVHAQLMIWRPVPRWEPSPEAYEPAVEALRFTHEGCASLASLGLLHGDLDEVVNGFLALTTGVVSMQLANGPDSALLAPLVTMFAHHYSKDTP